MLLLMSFVGAECLTSPNSRTGQRAGSLMHDSARVDE